MSIVNITQSDLTSGFFRIVHIVKGLVTNMHYPSDADLCPIYRWEKPMCHIAMERYSHLCNETFCIDGYIDPGAMVLMDKNGYIAGIQAGVSIDFPNS